MEEVPQERHVWRAVLRRVEVRGRGVCTELIFTKPPGYGPISTASDEDTRTRRVDALPGGARAVRWMGADLVS